eukprot:CAMPEP_0168743972 /NCGR_PEP_ID=MMETSP0724-20121128/13852_1 /TAXON_ID=265536 /ORGANISM="Amphiprora sp., Strain CCMP467" /LENGTH=105 /DNA_ID=CAMNT_0008791619 /DNA_START=299 /DNA_END=613 /DNA_ORIENTATION=-
MIRTIVPVVASTCTCALVVFLYRNKINVNEPQRTPSRGLLLYEASYYETFKVHPFQPSGFQPFHTLVYPPLPCVGTDGVQTPLQNQTQLAESSAEKKQQAVANHT